MTDSGAKQLHNRIASQIVERVRAQRLQAGEHLGEQDLADAFRVSRSPVRVALKLLEHMAVVQRRPNQGFFLKQGWEQLQPQPVTAGEQGEDELYYRIAEDHLSGALGLRFTERELIRRYGATRVRLTRLLTQMSDEGWLERLPGHGWEFQAVLTSVKTYEQSYRFRQLIEPLALEEPGYAIDQAAFDQVRREQQSMLDGELLRLSKAEVFRRGANFHETIVAASGNIFLIEGVRRVNRLRRLLEYHVNRDRSRLVNECRDHIDILDMIEAGDMVEAARFLRRHLSRASEAKMDLIAD